LGQNYEKLIEKVIKIIIKFLTFEQNFDKMSIGSKVRKFRNINNLSQNLLAEMADVSQSMI